MRNELPHGIRLLSHGRGNPETEVVRSLNGGTPHSNAGWGRPARPKDRAAKDSQGVRSAHSTWRRSRRSQGEGADGSTQLAKETLSGEEALEQAMPTSLLAIATRTPQKNFFFGSSYTEASIFEEPGAKKRHAGICAGAVWATGRPTAIARRQDPNGPSLERF